MPVTKAEVAAFESRIDGQFEAYLAKINCSHVNGSLRAAAHEAFKVGYGRGFVDGADYLLRGKTKQEGE